MQSLVNQNQSLNKPNPPQQTHKNLRFSSASKTIIPLTQNFSFKALNRRIRCRSFNFEFSGQKQEPKPPVNLPRPLKVLTFQELNLKWKSQLRPMDKEKDKPIRLQAIKKLPDSGSTVDPAQPRETKSKLNELEIKSIMSISDQDSEDETVYQKKKKVKVQESVIIVDFFKVDNQDVPQPIQFDKTKRIRKGHASFKLPGSNKFS